jgi:hypothetical protein
LEVCSGTARHSILEYVMKNLLFSLAVGSLGIAGTATAQTSTPTTATPATTTVTAPGAKPAKVKKVCRERMRSGSHLTNITCKTPAEWAALQADVDDQDEYGIPGNKVASGRALDHGMPRRTDGPSPN